MRRTVFVVLLGTTLIATTLASALAPKVAMEDPRMSLERSIGDITYRAMRDAAFEARVSHFLAEHGVDHPQKLDLQGATPQAAADHILTVETLHGRTPSEWVELLRAESLLSLRGEPALDANLVQDVARIERLAGKTVTPETLAQLDASAAAIPADVAPHFAALVRVVADAYESQLTFLPAIEARLLTAQGAIDLVLTDAEREAMLANALSIIAAENDFRLATEGLFEPVDGPTAATFEDPYGLVILGGTGDDTYDRGSIGVPFLGAQATDPVLVVEPLGNDVYKHAAAGACPVLVDAGLDCNGLAVATLLDLSGDDLYDYTNRPSAAQGAGVFGGVGVLFDVAGDDHYRSTQTRTSGALFNYIDGGAQGVGEAGVGVILDALGNDIYEANIASTGRSTWLFAHGFGGVGGVGVAADASGDDQWLSMGLFSEVDGFMGVYTEGVAIYPGVGIMADTGMGDDVYYAWDDASSTDYYAQGFGAFGGLGILYEDGGDDDYTAIESATNPVIIPLLNCAFGTGSLAGVGIMLELGGNDRYFGNSISPYAAYTMNEGFGGPGMAYGLFVDVSGDDGHFMYANGGAGSKTFGRGVLVVSPNAIFLGDGGNMFGTFLDLGGVDQYVGASPSADGANWAFGADVNAVPSVPMPSLLPGGL